MFLDVIRAMRKDKKSADAKQEKKGKKKL